MEICDIGKPSASVNRRSCGVTPFGLQSAFSNRVKDSMKQQVTGDLAPVSRDLEINGDLHCMCKLEIEGFC